MEPNKLETQMQEKLNSRVIQPSAQAWDRLDAMLSVAEQKKPKRKLSWLYIAASITGLLFVGAFLLNQNNNQESIINNSETIVNSNKEIENTEKSNISNQNTITKTEVELVPIENSEIALVSNIKKKINTPDKENSNNLVVNNFTEKNTTAITEVIAQKTEVKSTLEIDPKSLLVSIEKEKIDQKTYPKSTIKIDPQTLLSQVDGEIELSFRQKVIKTINKNYNSTKVALAARNQE